jgi:type III restriction enzyme
MEYPKDKGAKYRKADFQVHSPRDAGWNGADAITDDERKTYAKELISACRSKGIGALAITDHHDFAFFPFIKQAALNEVDASGTQVPEADRIVVFPGVEITLSAPPCQALLILDVDFPEDKLGTVLTALAISAVPSADSKMPTVVRIPTSAVSDLADLYVKLNNHECLRGRFVVFPNVSENGYNTLLRSGFADFYKSMPCVGGYTDGPANNFGTGNQGILSGQNVSYGKKAIAVFQTSDNRRRDHRDLGSHATWVKWADPSAEALRQACLAKRSRISLTEPAFPLTQLVGVIVSDSTFLGAVELGLNPQFNAFIGGRGTGKSSLLEYIRWALCDDPLEVKDGTELPNFQKRRQALVEQTLKPLGAKVSVFYKRNEVIYRIERSTADKSGTVGVFDPAGTEQRMTPEQVRREFPIVSYAQKQLSSVGTLPEEINRLITDPIKEPLAEVQDLIGKSILPQLKEQRTRERRLAVLNGQHAEITTAVKGKKEQVQALQTQLQSLTPEQQAVVLKHDILTQQSQALSRATELPQDISALLEQARNQIDSLPALTVSEALPDYAQVKAAANEALNYKKAVIEGIDKLIEQARSGKWATGENPAMIDALRETLRAHNTEYTKYVSESAKNEKQHTEITNLNKQIADLEGKLAAIDSERSTTKVLYDKVGTTKWDAFLEALAKRAALITAQCESINSQAQHEFRASVSFCADDSPLKAALGGILQGKNIKNGEQKIDALCAAVTGAEHPIKKWADVMAEFDLLVASKDAPTLPSIPVLRAAEFSDDNLRAIKLGVSQDSLEQIRYMNVSDQIVFSYKLGKKADGTINYIPFSSASQGQQATCLLRTLLSQSGAPLLIDQPEEDLDNEQIHVLSQRIAETKHNRQLLFVSHNANIVVNGDAELVVCFGYREAGDNTKGQISPVGSIDCAPVRKTITNVMEGGREAFELRRNKYGF